MKMHIIALLGGQYRGIFSSRVAVLARLQGGTIHNLRTEYSLYCPTLKGMQYNRFIIRLKFGGHSLGKGRGKGKRKGKEKRKEP